jgi:transposase
MHPGCDIEQVYLCREPIDFRKSINGLSVLVEHELGLNPFGSALHVFINRQHSKIKVLYWHRNGFWRIEYGPHDTSAVRLSDLSGDSGQALSL